MQKDNQEFEESYTGLTASKKNKESSDKLEASVEKPYKKVTIVENEMPSIPAGMPQNMSVSGSYQQPMVVPVIINQ